MNAGRIGHISLLLLIIVLSLACGENHRKSTGFVRPDLTNPATAVPTGTEQSPANASATAGATQNKAPTPPVPVPNTPLQKLLADQAKNGGSIQSAISGDTNLLYLPQTFRAKINLESIRNMLVNQINVDRKQAGLKPVLYDRVGELASNLHVLEQLDAKHWLSHYSLPGDLPYMRFSRVDGYDALEENAATMNISADHPSASAKAVEPGCNQLKVYPVPSAENIQVLVEHMVLALQCVMLNEKAPEDGHRQTILNPEATSVGVSIGVGLWNVTGPDGTIAPRITVFMMEEFASRGLAEVTPTPIAIKISDKKQVEFGGKLVEGVDLDHIRVFFESLQPRSADEAGKNLHYGFPNQYTVLLTPPPAGKQWVQKPGSAPLKAAIKSQGNSFSAPITFESGPGVYTIYVVGLKSGTKKPVPVASRSIYVSP